jgi:hypothetical protein
MLEEVQVDLFLQLADLQVDVILQVMWQTHTALRTTRPKQLENTKRRVGQAARLARRNRKG